MQHESWTLSPHGIERDTKQREMSLSASSTPAMGCLQKVIDSSLTFLSLPSGRGGLSPPNHFPKQGRHMEPQCRCSPQNGRRANKLVEGGPTTSTLHHPHEKLSPSASMRGKMWTSCKHCHGERPSQSAGNRPRHNRVVSAGPCMHATTYHSLSGELAAHRLTLTFVLKRHHITLLLQTGICENNAAEPFLHGQCEHGICG